MPRLHLPPCSKALARQAAERATDKHASIMMRLSAAAAANAEQHGHGRPSPMTWLRCCCASSSPRLVLEGGCYHWHCEAHGCAGALGGSRRPKNRPRPLKCFGRRPQSGRRRQTSSGPPCGPWPREAALEAVLSAWRWRTAARCPSERDDESNQGGSTNERRYEPRLAGAPWPCAL